MSSSKGSDLVSFNVGGKIYQVLREPTLSLHPTSLLTQLAEDQKDDKPIFVEGDQDLFKFVIDYHRDRKVILPVTVSRDAVKRELKRFALEPTEEQIVQDGVYFPEVMGKVAKWRDSNRTRKRKACQDLLGSCIAEAAYSKMSESAGKEFRVIRGDLPYSEKDFERLFGPGAGFQVAESEALKDFGTSFGYSLTCGNRMGSTGHFCWSHTDFKPA